MTIAPRRDGVVNPQRTVVNDPAAMTARIKAKATELGADMVGVCRLQPDMIDLGSEVPHEFVIAACVAEDYEKVMQGPDAVEEEAMWTYARCAEIATELAAQIRAMGYPARAHHNGGSEGQARAAYHRFVEEGIALGRRPELVGGGLIRSAGGWAEVRSQRQRREPQQSDERILGSGEFVERVLTEAQARVQHQQAARRQSGRVERVIAEACKKNGASLTELRSGSRRGKLPTIRAALVCKLVEDFGVAIAEVARQLGISTSGVSKILSRRLSS